MKPELSIQYVGGSDEEAAHLRLLLRKSRPRLHAAWHWSDEDAEPDLVIADPETLAGDAAVVQAREAGRAFALVVDGDALDSGDWQLRRPLKADALVRVVNALTPSGGTQTRVIAQDENFFMADLGEDDPAAGMALLDPDALASIPVGAANPREAEIAAEQEALFRRDPMDQSPKVAIPWTLDEDTTVSAVEGTSRRSQARGEDVRDRLHAGFDEDFADRTLRAQSSADLRTLRLVDYLDPRVLPGPARTTHGGLAPLVLDPRNECFHAPVDLPELELYCLQMIPMPAWERLTTAALEEVRASMPARPWSLLVWLYALLNSNQRLGPKLDPGGSFWLTGSLDLPGDYRSQLAIVEAMGEPGKLNEIAARAYATVGEVIDVVNAFDAVGLLGMNLRERLRNPGS